MFHKDSSRWEKFTTMTTARMEAAFVMFNDNKDLFLIGGLDEENEVLDTTEVDKRQETLC